MLQSKIEVPRDVRTWNRNKYFQPIGPRKIRNLFLNINKLIRIFENEFLILENDILIYVQENEFLISKVNFNSRN